MELAEELECKSCGFGMVVIVRKLGVGVKLSGY